MSKNKKIIFCAENKITFDAADEPKPSNNLIPDWYKKLPLYLQGDNKLKLYDGQPNTALKVCTPFLDALTTGYTYTLSNDVLVSWENGKPNFSWRGSRKMITDHPIEQTKGLPIPLGHYGQVFKWHNDFSIETPSEYSLWCTHPSNRFDLPFTTINGFVDTDRFNMGIHFPFFIKDGWTGIIEAGTPLAQLIPIKRDSWVSEKTNIEEHELLKRNQIYRKNIIRSYKKLFWTKKVYS